MATKLPVSWCYLLCICAAFSLTPFTDGATEYNRYLAHIFQRYGSGGTMSFEGLEHLMYNLGLGQIEFQPKHTVAEHRPKGYENLQPDNEQLLKAFFEKQTSQMLMTSEENDVEIKNDGNEQFKQQQQHAHSKKTTEAKLDDNSEDVFANVHGREIILEFKEMHDPKHRHPREENDAAAAFEASLTSSPGECLSPKSLLQLVVDHDDLHKRKLYKTFTQPANANDKIHNSEEEYNQFINNVKLTPVAFMKLCPVLLSQIDQNVCVRAVPAMHVENPKEMLWNAWFYATASIFVLSACGLLGVLLVPLMKTVAYQEILKFLVAVAVGTLSGDALMHLLPHALGADAEDSKHEHHDDALNTITSQGKSHAHEHDNRAVWICACAFGTAVFMYILESLLPLLKSDNSAGHGHSHGGGQNAPTQAVVEPPTADIKDVLEINMMMNEIKKDEKKPSSPLTPVAFMVVLGDGLHNLTDGLAIGAAFATDPVTGMATAFAVLCHELPHELGDFALLLQTGVSIKRAICLNIVSSVLSFVGMAVGLLIAGVQSNMTQWIYAGTAGSFLYIAFADLIPAMGGEHEKRDFKGALIQILGIIVGGFIMLLIAVNEDSLEVLFK